jgi:seryl-tRNA synthetase
MPSPIYRVIVEYGYKKKGSVRQYKYDKIDTFVLTNDVEKIKKDKNLMQKILRQSKSRNQELEITFKTIYVEGQYGETAY